MRERMEGPTKLRGPVLVVLEHADILAKNRDTFEAVGMCQIKVGTWWNRAVTVVLD